ncbi:MAG: DUF4233 domain-containing protein [Actinomycetia bacterium]|nr:DUF4233 domain-containing protein [Actinomycetes bacterium]MCH9800017.1 DUF4233 domain-containing protein [Actinomycetes bacterium]
MRVLCSAVLAFEWIVLALAIPVAINVSDVSADTAWTIFAIASVLTLAALALMRTPAGLWLGWSVQAVALISGLWVPMLGIMALIFAALYFTGIRLGGRVDQIKAEREAAAAQADATGTMAEPNNASDAGTVTEENHD